MLTNEIEDAKRLVKTDAYQMSVGELLNMYRDGELIINPDFQRLFRWDIGQKSRLIESLLLGIPLPSIFVFEKEDAKWELIDGLQRVSTLLEFMGVLKDPDTKALKPPTALVATKYLPSLDRVVWEKSRDIEDTPDSEQNILSGPLKLAIRRSRISVEILKRPSSNEAKYDLFQRLNAGGTQTNAQELRNVIVIMVNPVYHKFMRDCASHKPYLTVLSASEDQLEKQRDMEYVSRFLVHTYVDYDSKMNVEEFIDSEIVKLANSQNVANARKTFNATFDLLERAYGRDALRRFEHGNPVGRVLLAAYECIAIGVARNISKISKRQDSIDYVRNRILEFWKSPNIDEFFAAGLRGTVRIQRTVPFGTSWFAQ